MGFRIAMILAVLFAGGCATSSDAPTYDAAPVPTVAPDQAVLYIYREYAQPTAWPAYLEIDDQEVVSLAQKGFTWVYVKPGPHRFKFGWPMLAGMPTVKFEGVLKAGQAYAFEMRGRVTGGTTMTSTSAINPTSADRAKAKMAACCRYVAPKSPSF